MVEFQALAGGRNTVCFAFGDRGDPSVPSKRQGAFAGPVLWEGGAYGGVQAGGWEAAAAPVLWQEGPVSPGCGRQALPTDVSGQALVCVTGSKIWGNGKSGDRGPWSMGGERGRKWLGSGESPDLDPWVPPATPQGA